MPPVAVNGIVRVVPDVDAPLIVSVGVVVTMTLNGAVATIEPLPPAGTFQPPTSHG
jgi:hypothetical protein